MRAPAIVVIGATITAAGCHAVFGLDGLDSDRDQPSDPGCADPYAPVARLAAGAAPFALVSGDLDQDGRPELVAASRDQRVTVFYGTADGFGPGIVLTTTGEPRGLGLGELRRNHGDVAVCTAGANASAYLGDRPGSFDRHDLAIPAEPTALAIADLDAAHLDLIVASQAASRVDILAGDGEGRFTLAHTIPAAGPTALATADLDGDHHSDLVIVNTGATTVSVVLSTQPATRTAPRTVEVGSAPGPIAVGDLDGDGDLDLAVVRPAARALALVRNDGAGELTLGRTIDIGAGATDLRIAHLDVDTWPDLAIAEGGDGTVTIYRGGPDLDVTPSASVDLGAVPLALDVADFDLDDRHELAVATGDGSVHVLRACHGATLGVL